MQLPGQQNLENLNPPADSFIDWNDFNLVFTRKHWDENSKLQEGVPQGATELDTPADHRLE